MKTLIVFFFTASLFATSNLDSYNFLQSLEPANAPHEIEKPMLPPSKEAPVDLEFRDYYEAFKADGVVTMYQAIGAHHGAPSKRAEAIKSMLQSMTKKQKLPLGAFKVEKAELSFKNTKTGIRYVVQLGTDRKEFGSAFSKYEIISYVGHSRYGHGPAFKTMHDYFRMGSVFETTESDVRNPEYLTEPILLQEEFPLKSVTLNGTKYDYQYRGGEESSHLPDNSYTKNVPGLAVDWDNAKFLPGKQIYFLHSCSNIDYFKKPIRNTFPKPEEKMVVGTTESSFGKTASTAVFLALLSQDVDSTKLLLKELNKTDCKCFTTY